MTSVQARVDAALSRLCDGFAERRGYPVGDNHLAGPTTAAELAAFRSALGHLLPQSVARFFSSHREFRLPDLWTGIFVGPPSWVVSMREEIKTVGDQAGDIEVVAVGSDGGGRLFVVPSIADGPVVRLPTGAIRDGRYELPRRVPANVSLHQLTVARTFGGFIDRIIGALEEAADSDDRDPFL